MTNGDNVVLKESVIVTGSFGSEYLSKGTKGVCIGDQDGLAEVKTKHDTYYIPIESIALDEDAVAA